MSVVETMIGGNVCMSAGPWSVQIGGRTSTAKNRPAIVRLLKGSRCLNIN